MRLPLAVTLILAAVSACGCSEKNSVDINSYTDEAQGYVPGPDGAAASGRGTSTAAQPVQAPAPGGAIPPNGSRNPLLGSWVLAHNNVGTDGEPTTCPERLVFDSQHQQIVTNGQVDDAHGMTVSYGYVDGRARVIGNSGNSLSFDFSDANTIF